MVLEEPIRGPFTAIEEGGRLRDGFIPALRDDEVKKLYSTMVLVRALDTKMLILQRQGRISFLCPCTGEEAAHVGSAYALSPPDWVFPAYREQAVAIARGMPLSKVLAQSIGSGADILKGRQMPNHWGSRAINLVAPSSPVGTQIPQAAGMALAAKIRGDGVVAIAYFGDGGTSSSDFHSGLNFAGVFSTPTVFFCRNNQYALSVPLSRQTKVTNLYIKASAYGIRGIQVDGNDLIAVHYVTKEAVERARAGHGPTFIEAVTYRVGPHSSSDDPTRYRSKEEVELWKKRDPIERTKSYLVRRGILTEEEDAITRNEAEASVEEALREAEKAPPPSPKTIFEDVYGTMPWHIKEEMEELLQETGEG